MEACDWRKQGGADVAEDVSGNRRIGALLLERRHRRLLPQAYSQLRDFSNKQITTEVAFWAA